MCGPAALVVATTALTVAGTATSTIASNQRAQAQAESIAAQNQQRKEEIKEQAEVARFDRTRRAAREAARARVAGAQQGLNLGGNSIEALLLDIDTQANIDNARERANAETRQRRADAIADARISRLGKTTALGAGLQIAQQGTQSFLTSNAAAGNPI